jgi:hypothetical protein
MMDAPLCRIFLRDAVNPAGVVEVVGEVMKISLWKVSKYE